MSRWLAYHGDRYLFGLRLIYQPEHSLNSAKCRGRIKNELFELMGMVFGLGWYSHRALPGYYHDILPIWGDENLRSLAHHIKLSSLYGTYSAFYGITSIAC